LQEKGFLEVETPILEHFTGGADARPFKTHHNALDEDFYLRISTELYQKRLIGAGFEKIYTLGPNFRNEGIDDEHLQEYYQVEWYWAYANYRDNMNLVRDMFRFIAQEVYGKTKFESKGHTFDLADEWQEIDYVSIIKEKFNLDIFDSSDEEILKVVKDSGIALEGTINRSRLIDNLWKLLRKDITGPAFLVNEPKFMSPLAKSKPEDERLTERFHIIIAGSELGNGYSELNDPVDQYNRFIEQQKARDAGDEEAQMMDIDYVEMLEYGMPPVSGYGHSERLFWFLENIPAREGTLFPQMKLKVDESVKEIYPEYKINSSAKKSEK
jgi:lysyl-tRNA synthetase class 2